MKEGLISIIIPTYNRAHYLRFTLQSIESQTYTNWECIVVDDGSTDDTEMLVQQFLKDERFKFMKRPGTFSKGANSCRNYGLEHSKGEFIQWFDSDDVMLPQHLEILLNAITSCGVDFAVGDSLNFIDATGETAGKPYSFNRNNRKITAEDFAMQRIGWITDDFLGKRASIGTLRFNTQILTDGDEYNFFTRYLVNNEFGVLVDEILTRRRLHESALSSPSNYDEVQFLHKISKIKFLTFLDLRKTSRLDLKRWFLKGYMLNSYYLAQKNERPQFLIKSFLFILKCFSLRKAIAFLLAIALASITGRGYIFLRYSRAY